MRPLLIGLILALGACAAAPEAGPGASDNERPLAQVSGVGLAPAGPNLTIRVRAMAPTPGYTGLRLRPVNYIQAPPDGIYDFTAVGVPPGGIVAQVLTPVEFTYTWESYGSDVKGVRVHAAAGPVTEMLRR